MKTIYLFILMLVASVGFSQTECKQFIQGKYYEQAGEVPGYIEFKGDYLYEINGDEYMKSKLTWLNDCSYELEFIETNSKDIVVPKGAKLEVKILNAKEDEFTVMFGFIPSELSEPIKMVRYKD